jgi:MFS family permease
VLASVLPDRHLKKGAQAPLELVGFFKSFWLNPCRYPDFGWAFVGRFLMSLGLATYGNYTVYRLIDHLHYTPLHIPGLLLIGGTLITIVTTAAAILGGMLSDQLRRRKVFVIVAALFYTVGNVIVALSHSFAVYLIGGGLAGTAIRSTWRYLGKQTNTQAAISPEVL